MSPSQLAATEKAVLVTTLDRIQLVEIAVSAIFILQECLDCPTCDAWYDHLVEDGPEIESSELEVCECEIMARGVMDRLVGPRYECLIDEYLRNYGHDPDEIGRRTAALVERLLEKHKPKGEEDDESDT